MTMSLLRRTLCLVPMLLTLSCNALETDPERERLTILTSVDKSTLGLNETMSIAVTVHNVGLEALPLTGPSDCLIFIEVLDTDGDRRYTSASQCSGNTVTEEIAAGAQRTASFLWDGNANSGSRLPSGLYLLRPIVLLSSGARPGLGEEIAIE
jgi:hypothetical protein